MNRCVAFLRGLDFGGRRIASGTSMPPTEPAVDPEAQLCVHRGSGKADRQEYPTGRSQNENRNRHDGSRKRAGCERTSRRSGKSIHQVHTMMIRAMIETGEANLKPRPIPSLTRWARNSGG